MAGASPKERFNMDILALGGSCSSNLGDVWSQPVRHSCLWGLALCPHYSARVLDSGCLLGRQKALRAWVSQTSRCTWLFRSELTLRPWLGLGGQKTFRALCSKVGVATPVFAI